MKSAHFFAQKLVFLAGIMLLLTANLAQAQETIEFTTKSGENYGRILAIWPETNNGKKVRISTDIKNGVLVIKFNQPFSGDLTPIREGLPGLVALARMDVDGQTIRIALRAEAEVSSSQSYNVFAVDLIKPGSVAEPPKVSSAIAKRKALQAQQTRQRAAAEMEKIKRQERPNPALPLQVRYAESAENTRISFDWVDPVQYRTLQRKDGLDLIFDRVASPAIAEVNVAKPKGLLSISSINRKDKTIIAVNTEPGFSHRVSREGTRVYLDLFERKPQHDQVVKDKTPIAKDPAPLALDFDNRKNPVPASGEVAVKVIASGSALHLQFDWEAPIGAAAFRRGDELWIVFDAAAKLNLSELTSGGRRHASNSVFFSGTDHSGIRMHIPAATQVEARPNGDGSSWKFVLDDKLEFPTTEIDLRRESDGSGPGKLAAWFKNASALLWVNDPQVGDDFAVVTGLGPASGISTLRRFVEVNALASAQGMAFEILADGLDVQLQGEELSIISDKGLTLTPSSTPLIAKSDRDRPFNAIANPAVTASPGFVDFIAWKRLGGEETFYKSYSAILRRVAIEDTDPEARMVLARFLIAHKLGAEALGALKLAQSLDPMLVQDSRFRTLRGVANLQMGRIKDAKADFSAQTLNFDPYAALWRGLLAARTENWTEARQNFEKGRDALYLFTPEWQAIFHTAFARAAMNLNDLGTAKNQLREIFGENLSLQTQLDATLARAELYDRNNEVDKALNILDNIIKSGDEPLVVRAIFEQTRILRENNRISPLKASDILENLRFRWRGDEVELEAVRSLGAFYSEAGDYRRAMEAMSLAIRRFSDSPVARRLLKDLNQTFLDLFLKGGANAMDPVQALALFYQFQEFTPLGNEGQRMVRKMADRLIAFDLLPQAADLLQYQVDQQLYGMGKAQIATDLALVYLMDKHPEKALRAIQSSRQARLPRELNRERRLLEARALVALGRPEHAMDLIESDRTRAADFLRADILWASQDWSKIYTHLNRVISRHINNPIDLSEDEAAIILRSVLAAALANKKPEFDALISKWSAPMAKTQKADAFALISSKTSINGVEVKDLARTIGGTDAMRSFLDQYRNRVSTRDNTQAAMGQNVDKTSTSAVSEG